MIHFLLIVLIFTGIYMMFGMGLFMALFLGIASTVALGILLFIAGIFMVHHIVENTGKHICENKG